MDFGHLLKNMDFANEKHLKRVRDAVNEELRQRISGQPDASNIHERLLVSAQKQVLPLINAILDFKSFHEFADLKNAVDYIAACQQENMALPYDIGNYYDLCYRTAFIFDNNMEDECDGDEIEKYNRLRDAYYEEIPQKDPETQIIAGEFWYPVFEEYFCFLGYFDNEKGDREKEVRICIRLINDILFDVLWALDCTSQHKMEDSHFRKAVMNIFQ